MKRKTIKKVLALFLALSISGISTSSPIQVIDAFAQDPYEIWAAPYTEKVIQETNLLNYSALRTTAKIDLDMAQAETETAQIVLTANQKISNYSVTLNDLTDAEGNVIKKEDVSVEFDNGYLIISAKKEPSEEDLKYIWRERFSGSIKRSYYLGNKFSADDVSASMADGILKVVVNKPKQEKQSSRLISIN